MSNPWYLSCSQCKKLTLALSSMSTVMCFDCSVGARPSRSYVPNVIPLKPGERTNNEQKPAEQPKPSLAQSQTKPFQEDVGATDTLKYSRWPQSKPSPQAQSSQGKGAPGLKDDAGKLMWHLLPWKAVEGMVKVLTFGAKKYSPNGWRSVPDAENRYLAATLRHLRAISAGEKIDPESGLRHIDHVLTNAAFLAELED